MSLLNNMIPQRFLLVFHNEHGKACAVTSDNCILEDPGEYYESQAVCKWEIVGGPAYLKVNRFHIGEDDTLTIYDGKEDRTRIYNGENGRPHGIVVSDGTKFIWRSDGGQEKLSVGRGFRVCASKAPGS